MKFSASWAAIRWDKPIWCAGKFSKKKASEIEKERRAFIYGDEKRGISGCMSLGISESTAQDIYDEIYDFANYAFNKGYAVAMPSLPIRPRGLSATTHGNIWRHMLTSVLDSHEKVAEYIAECKSVGIGLLPARH